VRQLITRIDDLLHARLKERARAEGRSVNALVTELLEAGVGVDDRRRAFRERLRAEGRLVEPPRPENVLTLDEVLALSKGSGTAVSEALEADRAAR